MSMCVVWWWVGLDSGCVVWFVVSVLVLCGCLVIFVWCSGLYLVGCCFIVLGWLVCLV